MISHSICTLFAVYKCRLLCNLPFNILGKRPSSEICTGVESRAKNKKQKPGYPKQILYSTLNISLLYCYEHTFR